MYEIVKREQIYVIVKREAESTHAFDSEFVISPGTSFLSRKPPHLQVRLHVVGESGESISEAGEFRSTTAPKSHLFE